MPSPPGRFPWKNKNTVAVLCFVFMIVGGGYRMVVFDGFMMGFDGFDLVWWIHFDF